MVETELSGDHATLVRHLQKTSFLAGVEEGRWQVLGFNFPYLEVRIWSRSITGSNHTMDFQLECLGFPAAGPFIQHWDFERRVRPPPPDNRIAAPSVIDALKEWGEQPRRYDGIYRPWQRGAAVHNDWARKRPDLAWHPKRELTFIMEQLYGLVSEQAFWLDSKIAA
jgi:hypothetical protein